MLANRLDRCATITEQCIQSPSTKTGLALTVALRCHWRCGCRLVVTTGPVFQIGSNPPRQHYKKPQTGLAFTTLSDRRHHMPLLHARHALARHTCTVPDHTADRDKRSCLASRSHHAYKASAPQRRCRHWCRPRRRCAAGLTLCISHPPHFTR